MTNPDLQQFSGTIEQIQKAIGYLDEVDAILHQAKVVCARESVSDWIHPHIGQEQRRLEQTRAGLQRVIQGLTN